jgi:predicted amidophosphoribosyltransferase
MAWALLARLLTHYLRWFHRRTAITLVPSASQRLELERRGFERLDLLARGSMPACSTRPGAARPCESWG